MLAIFIDRIIIALRCGIISAVSVGAGNSACHGLSDDILLRLIRLMKILTFRDQQDECKVSCFLADEEDVSKHKRSVIAIITCF